MEEGRVRRLVAVMFCDMVGFTAAMQTDERSALTARDRFGSVIEELHGRFGGEVVQYFGDGVLSMFSSAADAVRCGVAIQQTLNGEPRVPVRVGVHVGDVLVEAHGLVGDAVNVASRIESFGVAGAVLLSDSVYELVKNQSDLSFASLGGFAFHNVARTVELFAVDADRLVVPDAGALVGKGRRAGGVSNLPVQVTSFVGRVQESAELAKLTRGSRLVTITGAGGCGKSRLAVEVAADMLGEFDDGVRLIELASLSDGRLVASTVANVLGVQEQPGVDTLDLLTRYLANRQMLVLIDNCEHLIEPVADMVSHLLTRTNDLRVVATSREPLHVRGEAIYHLPTLPIPDQDDDWETVTHVDSVRLFAERADAAHPGFRVTHDNGQAVTSICRHLDGIPLAVELAASATRMLTCEQIDLRLADRFSLLKSGARDDVYHHRALEAAIDWSYGLLPPEQQTLFVRLAVFAGPFSLEAAEQVCGDDAIPAPSLFGHIVKLVDRSLLETEQTGLGVRYRMLETIRAYATAQLTSLPEAVQEDLRRRHCDYFLSLAEEVTEGPISADAPPPWLAKLDAVLPDLRQAFQWAIEGGHDQQAISLFGSLWSFLQLSERRAEAVHWAQSAPLDSTQATPQSRIEALRNAATSLAGYGTAEAIDLTKAKQIAQMSLQLARQTGDHVQIAESLREMGVVSWMAGAPQEALSILQEALKEAKAGDNAWQAARIRHFLGIYRHFDGSTETAKALLEENLPVFRQLRDDRMIGLTLGFLGGAESLEGNLEKARPILEESLDIGQQLDNFAIISNALEFLGQLEYFNGDHQIAATLYRQRNDLNRRVLGRESLDAHLGLGFVAIAQGDDTTARTHLHHILRAFRELPESSTWDAPLIARGLWGTALILTRNGALTDAAILSAAAETATRPTPAHLPWFVNSFENDWHQHMTATIQSALPTREYQQAKQQGAAMTLDEAIDYALNLLDGT